MVGEDRSLPVPHSRRTPPTLAKEEETKFRSDQLETESALNNRPTVKESISPSSAATGTRLPP
jgi:hypothetical protein